MVVRSAPGESVTFRALGLLDAFDERHRVLTLSQIARRADVPVATAQRRLGDLVAGRLLHRRPDGRYEIGPRMWHLGQLSRPTLMREAALPHLQDLVALTGHTAHLAVLDGIGALVVDRIAGSRTLPTRHSPGGRLPLHCTAVGKVLLAFAPDSVREPAMRMLVGETPHTITDPAVMAKHLDEVRRTRVAPSRQEHRPGVSSIASPVFQGPDVIAAIGLLAPLQSHLGGTAEPLRRCASAIGAAVADRERRLMED